MKVIFATILLIIIVFCQQCVDKVNSKESLIKMCGVDLNSSESAYGCFEFVSSRLETSLCSLPAYSTARLWFSNHSQFPVINGIYWYCVEPPVAVKLFYCSAPNLCLGGSGSGPTCLTGCGGTGSCRCCSCCCACQGTVTFSNLTPFLLSMQNGSMYNSSTISSTPLTFTTFNASTADTTTAATNSPQPTSEKTSIWQSSPVTSTEAKTWETTLFSSNYFTKYTNVTTITTLTQWSTQPRKVFVDSNSSPVALTAGITVILVILVICIASALAYLWVQQQTDPPNRPSRSRKRTRRSRQNTIGTVALADHQNGAELASPFGTERLRSSSRSRRLHDANVTIGTVDLAQAEPVAGPLRDISSHFIPANNYARVSAVSTTRTTEFYQFTPANNYEKVDAAQVTDSIGKSSSTVVPSSMDKYNQRLVGTKSASFNY